MKVIRILLAALLVTSASLAITRIALPRLACNLAKGQINRDVRRMGRTGNEFERYEKARANVARCRECIAEFPQDHHLYLLLGANLRVLGEYDAAIAELRNALKLIERPEIYAQIGEIEIERGNLQAGHDAILRASIFQIYYIDMVSEPMRSEIQNEVMARYDKLRATIPAQ